MTDPLVALGGWVMATVAGLLALLIQRRLEARRVGVARACHELRNPITAARLGLECCAQTGELSADAMRAIELELGRASLALDDLVAPGGDGCNPRALERVDVAGLVADSTNAWRPSARCRAVGLAARWTGPAAEVLGDKLRLAQATGNLIANAIEHGDGPVDVWGRADGAVVRIEISDAGPGLPAPISQLVRRPLRGAPRGHGLSIASEIARAHGGRLAAAPSDRGTRLVLELPGAAPVDGVAARLTNISE